MKKSARQSLMSKRFITFINRMNFLVFYFSEDVTTTTSLRKK